MSRAAAAATTGLATRHADCRGRRRSGGRRGRHGHHPAGRGQRHDRHVGRGFRGDRPAGARSQRPHPHVLSRDPGPLARDGRDAGRRTVAAVAARSVVRGRRRGRRRVRPDDRRSASCAGRCRRRALGAVPHGRTHAALRSGRARGARRAGRESHARPRRSRGARRRRLQPARHVRHLRRTGRAGRRACASAAAARARRCGARFRPPSTASPVETVAAEEGAAYGAALLAGVGVGMWPSVDEACDAVVRTAEVTTPEPADVDIMNAQYAGYQRLYPALRRMRTRLSSDSDALEAGGAPMSDSYTPRPEHKFSFGLWTVGNRGRDPFGDAVREPLPPIDAVAMLGEVGAWGVNLHDNDLVPIDATPSERDRIVREFKTRLRRSTASWCRWPRSTCSPIPCSATAPSPRTTRPCAPTPCRRRCAPWTSARSSARRSSCCGADAKGRRPTRAGGRTTPCKRLREAVNYLCEYSIDRKYGYRFALEAKPNEPRGDIYMATTGNYLGFIPTLAHPEHGRRQSGGRARDDGRAELRARRRAGLGSRQAVSHRSQRPGAAAATTRISGSARRIRSRPSFS